MKCKLIVVQGKPVGKSLAFALGEYYLGRGPECHLRFNSDWVSRQHCVLRVGELAVSLRDLSSRNGTLVNGRLVQQEVNLGQGDQVQIGPVVFEVRFEDPTGNTPPEALSASSTLMRGDADSATKEPSSGSTARHAPLQQED
jgi:pSer/pThr/pTyr-binding forkhead associated (FHA) protein